MSTSLLYHAFGIVGYFYQSTRFIAGIIIVSIQEDKWRLRCPVSTTNPHIDSCWFVICTLNDAYTDIASYRDFDIGRCNLNRLIFTITL